MAVYGYARASVPQGIAGQVERLRESGCPVVFNEVRASPGPPGEAWQDLISTVQAGDTVRVVEWSRLTRSLETARFMQDALRELEVTIEELDPSGPDGNPG